MMPTRSWCMPVGERQMKTVTHSGCPLESLSLESSDVWPKNMLRLLRLLPSTPSGAAELAASSSPWLTGDVQRGRE